MYYNYSSQSTHYNQHINLQHHTMQSPTKHFKLTISSINYADTPPNILEYYSDDLTHNQAFNDAIKEFQTITYNQFINNVYNKQLPKDHQPYYPIHIELSTEEKDLPIFTLAQKRKIYWDGDNKASDRPNVITYSGVMDTAFTNSQVFTWYSSAINQFNIALQQEADDNVEGDINKVKAGILVYDLLCNYIYDKYHLNTVRSSMRTKSIQEQNLFQINKFNQIIKPLLGTNIIAIQEAPDNLTSLHSSWLCLKKYVLPPNKSVISGSTNSKISLIVDSDIKHNITLIPTPSIESHKFLKKTSCFKLLHQDKSILIVVIHMKNPKSNASLVASDLKDLIGKIKTTDIFNHTIVIGDTNLERKNKCIPNQFASMLDLQYVHNSEPTTSKKRTPLQAQVDKTDKESLEEKDACFHTNTLHPTELLLLPQIEHKPSNSIYPSLGDIDYLPKPSWPSDHRALVVNFIEKHI